MLYLGTFRVTYEKTLLSHLKQPRIFQNPKFRAKLKILKFWTKIALFECFWTEIWKHYWHILNQRPQLCLIARFRVKIKMWPKILFWVILDKNLKKLFSYLKLTPSNLSNCKVSRKNKNSKIWNQRWPICVFWAAVLEIFIFWVVVIKKIH